MGDGEGIWYEAEQRDGEIIVKDLGLCVRGLRTSCKGGALSELKKVLRIADLNKDLQN